ncbi:NADH-quinone oxidoreductase subunit NuoB [Thermus sp. SYSU G05001]|uniref:NADH-quinone oxidoreductase subunit NuoB n=1 Tax=Thermus brevis TaxID=2862456 RepID=A0ABS6ZXZ2_9DEIN|nr:NADH-quinone oxidoreductase subunit NuoB [Thermus brevis]MBW6394927.1 NADH-quinone oxidoreductase subunit NuoB [Thermus brevis]
MSLIHTLKVGRLARKLEEILKVPQHAFGYPLLNPAGLTPRVREGLIHLCPSGAFAEAEGVFSLDLARCVGCGRCALAYPEAVGEMRSLEVAVTRKEDLVQRVDLERGGFLDPGPPPSPRTELRLPTLAFREVSAGDTGLADSEIALLGNPFNDMGRFGFQVVASPRHADALLVTGPVSRNMAEALRRTYEAMPEPKGVVAVGNEAISGGVFAGSPQVLSGVDQVVPVDVYVPGDPPRPGAILHGLMLLVGRMTQRLVGGVLR